MNKTTLIKRILLAVRPYDKNIVATETEEGFSLKAINFNQTVVEIILPMIKENGFSYFFYNMNTDYYIVLYIYK